MPRTLASSNAAVVRRVPIPVALDAVIDDNRAEQRPVRVDLQRGAPDHAAVGSCHDRGVEMVEQAIDRQVCCGQQLQDRWPVLAVARSMLA